MRKDELVKLFNDLSQIMGEANGNYDPIWDKIQSSVFQFNLIIDNLRISKDENYSMKYDISHGDKRYIEFNSKEDKARYAIYHFLSGVDSRIPLCCNIAFCFIWMGIGGMLFQPVGAYYQCSKCRGKHQKPIKILINNRDDAWWYRAINWGRNLAGNYSIIDCSNDKKHFYLINEV